MEELIRQLADKGFKIAIAAGNVDALGGQGYVQTISPARAGAYEGKAAKLVEPGGVMTASAIGEDGRFWPFSAFGNHTYLPNGSPGNGPPDFAEPRRQDHFALAERFTRGVLGNVLRRGASVGVAASRGGQDRSEQTGRGRSGLRIRIIRDISTRPSRT